MKNERTQSGIAVGDRGEKFEIITEELGERTFPEKEAPIVKRVIHTTADFEYADSLVFSPGAVDKALEALKMGRAS